MVSCGSKDGLKKEDMCSKEIGLRDIIIITILGSRFNTTGETYMIIL